jgi:hypothetical protein
MPESREGISLMIDADLTLHLATWQGIDAGIHKSRRRRTARHGLDRHQHEERLESTFAGSTPQRTLDGSESNGKTSETPLCDGLSLLARRFSSPRGVEGGLIARMLPARSQLTVADLVNVDGGIFLLLSTARESMPGKNDAVLIVCENVLYILLKRTACRRHSLLGKLVKALLAAVRASDCSLSRNVEVPILRTCTEIAVQTPTRECGVRFSDDRFYWMCHDASGYVAAGLLH